MNQEQDEIDQEALKEYQQELSKPVSKVLFLKIFLGLLLLSFLGIFGFYGFQEYSKSGGNGFVLASKQIPSTQNYDNDYWGFSLSYPGNWQEAVGSVKDGEYYFSSQSINFTSELDPGQALVTVKTYNNYSNMNFEDWLSKQEQTYYNPGEIVLKEPANIDGLEAKHYLIKPAHPKNNLSYIDMLVISKNLKTKIEISLTTDSEATHSQFQNTYNSIENSLKFYPGLEEK